MYALSLDKLVFKWIPREIFNPDARLLEEISAFLGVKIEDAVYTESPSKKTFFFKEAGIDLKFTFHHFYIEFHSTFFCYEGSFELTRKLGLYLSEYFGLQLTITEMHIAQDFDDISPSDFFAKGFNHPSYYMGFNATFQPFVGTEELESFYLKDTAKNRWSFICYNKTKELSDNKSKYTLFKFNHYKQRGYLEKEITRAELRLNSEHCRKHFEAFFLSESLVDFCSHVLGSFYKKHKIYLLKPGETFNKKRPENHQKYYLWHRIFNKRKNESFLKDFNEILELETLSKKQVVSRISNLLAKYHAPMNPDILKEIIEEAKKKKTDRFERRQKTIERQKLILDSYSKKPKEVLMVHPDNGKLIPNITTERFIVLKPSR